MFPSTYPPFDSAWHNSQAEKFMLATIWISMYPQKFMYVQAQTFYVIVVPLHECAYLKLDRRLLIGCDDRPAIQWPHPNPVLLWRIGHVLPGHCDPSRCLVQQEGRSSDLNTGIYHWQIFTLALQLISTPVLRFLNESKCMVGLDKHWLFLAIGNVLTTALPYLCWQLHFHIWWVWEGSPPPLHCSAAQWWHSALPATTAHTHPSCTL